MDREQEELQFLGFFGIFKESIKLILTCSKIFTKITLSLILPLSFTFLSHIFLSMLLSSKIIHNEHTSDRTHDGTSAYNTASAVISSEFTSYWLIKAAYFTFLLIFSLLSTAAVVYTVACVYTAKDITFRKVMSVVPEVWKRLMVTFLWSFAIVFIYSTFLMFVTVIWVVFISGGHPGSAIVGLMTVIDFVGLVYISMIWQLAGVVSVLEDSKGLQAVRKSKDLIKGKTVLAMAIFLKLHLWLLLIQFLFKHFVVVGRSIGIAKKVGFGIVSLLLLSMVFLLWLVVQTVIYFVCKSYHRENIDKSSLADHLEVYLGEDVPLKAKDM